MSRTTIRKSEIALKLGQLRHSIETESKAPLTDGEQCLLFDVCQSLELDENQTTYVIGKLTNHTVFQTNHFVLNPAALVEVGQ